LKPIAATKMNSAPNNPEGSDPPPWPDPVDGVELLDELRAYFRRFLVLSAGAAEILALWVLFTHIIDISPVAPRLAILSATPRCGKTTLLQMLILLVRHPLPASNITPAVVYRVIQQEQPTLLIDEGDTFLSPALTGIINSGHTRATAYVWRSAHDNFQPLRFSTFAAIAIAQIGKLPPTLEDRSFVIWMKRRRSDEKVERFRSDRTGDLLILKRKATRWATDYQDKVAAADPEIPEGLNDRAADNWRILLAVAHVAGGDWSEIASHVALATGGKEDPSELAALLHDIHDIFDERRVDRLTSVELCAALSGLDHRPWGEMNKGGRITPIQLADKLEPLDIRPKVRRIGGKTPRGYERSQFADAFARYPRP
jgi:putative DNA primase/helicase